MKLRWAVELVDSPDLALAAVPAQERCHIPQEDWPRPLDDTPRGQVRAVLVEALGEACSICRTR